MFTQLWMSSGHRVYESASSHCNIYFKGNELKPGNTSSKTMLHPFINMENICLDFRLCTVSTTVAHRSDALRLTNSRSHLEPFYNEGFLMNIVFLILTVGYCCEWQHVQLGPRQTFTLSNVTRSSSTTVCSTTSSIHKIISTHVVQRLSSFSLIRTRDREHVFNKVQHEQKIIVI